MTYVYDDVTYVYDDVTYAYDDVTHDIPPYPPGKKSASTAPAPEILRSQRPSTYKSTYYIAKEPYYIGKRALSYRQKSLII